MDANDRDHEASAELLGSATDALLVPAPVLVELDWLGASRKVPATETILAAILSGECSVVDLELDDYERVTELCADYADLPLGFVDASVIAIAERERERTVATLDHRHFSVVRPRHVNPLTLVPELS